MHAQTKIVVSTHLCCDKYSTKPLILFLSAQGESTQSKKRKICKAGAGVEHHASKNNTPGFPKRLRATISSDIRGFKRLDLPRNHRRITQTSLLLSQTWRANCDIQILLYDTDPLNPDPAEVARATDYIVAYACKGVETLQEEKRQMISLAMQASETFGDVTDVQRIARQLLNRTIGEKMISKQEAMVLAGKLKLVDCSESIDTVSVSGYYKLGKGSNASTFLQKYAKRNIDVHHHTLHQYFHHMKNKTTNVSNASCSYIPHYVGASSYPVYPPTLSYARSMILIHAPWHTKFDGTRDFLHIFKSCMDAGIFPPSVTIPYLRVKARYEAKNQFIEPTNTFDDPISPFLSENIPQDLRDIVALSNHLPHDAAEHPDNDGIHLDLGLEYDWSEQHHAKCCPQKATAFLQHKIESQKKKESKHLSLPRDTKGNPFLIQDLREDQQDILAYVLARLYQWVNITAHASEPFQPLRLTICGQAGSGKSVTHTNTCYYNTNHFPKK